jgi:hypothetical protein
LEDDRLAVLWFPLGYGSRFFVWNGWFWDWAAFRNHSDSEAGDILFEQDRMAMCIGIAIHVAIYALFPALCYFNRRTERVKALH